MADLIPFKAYRPFSKNVKAISCRPYDVLNANEAREICKDNDISFYRVTKPEICFSDDFDQYSPEVYKKGKENFDKLVDNGLMVQDDDENFYVYQLIMGDHKQSGLVGCCSIDDYFNNVIKKHELTRPDKEKDRKNHVSYSKLNYEPVFLAYPHVNAIDELVEDVKQADPIYEFTTDDGIQHSLWIVNKQETVNAIANLFKEQVKSIYIADGHHRTAAGALAGKELRDENNGNKDDGKLYNNFMAVLFPDNQLKIIDYNRVVKDLNGIDETSFIASISEKFEIIETSGQYRPESFHHFGMYLSGKWYKMVSKKETYNAEDPIDVLDVTILSKQILEPLLNIVDLRTDKRIDFVGGVRGLEELEKRVNSGEMKVAFALHPVSMSHLIEVSDRDMIMPPKVTWFVPKLRSGLFVYSLVD